MLDVQSGRVPNYGANDGALILPLSSCDYADYRMTVQLAQCQVTGQRVLGSGSWDEAILWLFGEDQLRNDTGGFRPISRQFDAGGYYTIRGKDTWCMARCHTYRDRPAHVDMLHVDLWYKGVNLLGDSGSYKYYVPESPALERYFKDIQAHNTIEIDGRGPLDLVSRFLWLPWPKARSLEHTDDAWQGVHFGYDRLPWQVRHCRRLRLVDNREWVVTDELAGKGRHRIALRWHLVDGSCRLDDTTRQVELDVAGMSARLSFDGIEGLDINLNRGVSDDCRTEGWESVYYSDKCPRPTIIVSGFVQLPQTLLTRITLS
jgi:asparagine synthase (glutamine-hydrolysing)